jgi:hypothetical protein
MLTKLLEILQRGGIHRISDLAGELQTSPELVGMMLQDLARLGYLKPMGDGCSQGCGGCPQMSHCGDGLQAWTALIDDKDQGDF